MTRTMRMKQVNVKGCAWALPQIHRCLGPRDSIVVFVLLDQPWWTELSRKETLASGWMWKPPRTAQGGRRPARRVLVVVEKIPYSSPSTEPFPQSRRFLRARFDGR